MIDIAQEVRSWVDNKFDKSIKIDGPRTPGGDPCIAFSMGWALNSPKSKTPEQIFEWIKGQINGSQYAGKPFCNYPSDSTVYWREYPQVVSDIPREFGGKEYQCEKLYFRMAIE